MIPYRLLKRIVKRLIEHRLLSALVVALAIDLISAILFYIFEHGVQESLTFFDCIYWATITMSTIGYGDITPHTVEGKTLATFTSVAGIASFTLLVSLLAEKFLMATIKRREGLIKIRKANVLVICDSELKAKEIVDELKRGGGFSDIAVLLPHHPKPPRMTFEWSDVEIVRGEVVSEEALSRAGVDKADIVIISLADDSKIVYLVLKIRRRNKSCKICAKANSFEAVDLLFEAGATDVISPIAQEKLLASCAHEPYVVRFIVDAIEAGRGVDLEQRKPPQDIIGMRFIDAMTMLKRNEDVILVAVVRDGRVYANPSEDMIIESGDILITLKKAEEAKS